MSSEYTPTLGTLRVAWVAHAAPGSAAEVRRLQAVFDRAVAAHDREVAAKAFDEGWVARANRDPLNPDPGAPPPLRRLNPYREAR